MKVKFTKLAALLLAGAALFATGCTDYEVDIQKVDEKVDALANGRVATLENQLAALTATLQSDYETIANHNKDVQAINKTITDLDAALRALIDTKADKAAFEDFKTKAQAAIDALNALTAGFPEGTTIKKYIDDLNASMDSRVDALEGLLAGDWNGKTVLETIAALETEFRTALGVLDGRLKAAEKSIKTLEEVTIPGIKNQITALETLTAGDWGDVTIKEYIDAVKETLRVLAENYAALVDGLEGKSIKEYVEGKLDDYVLKTTFQALADVVGTEAELKEFKGTIISNINALNTLTAGDWGGKTIKDYVDNEVNKLQAKLSEITNEAGTGRLDVLEDEHAKLAEKVDKIYNLIKFAENYEGEYGVGLQGYIDDGDAAMLKDAKKYTDDMIKLLKEWVADEIKLIYSYIQDLQKRIQSIVFVPDYDDLKITTNMSKMTVPGTDGVIFMDQLSTVTYEILPAQYASKIADNFADYLTFDVKSVKTRADDDAEIVPKFQIVKAEYDKETVDQTGLVTFTVLPVNVASAQYEANGYKPRYDLDFIYEWFDCGLVVWGNSIYYLGSEFNTDWVQVGKWDVDLQDFTETWDLYGINPDEPNLEGMTVGVWDYQEILAYQYRAAFAASLRLKNAEKNDGYDMYYNDDVYMEYNEVASTYNVLYPASLADIDVLPDVYRPEEDEDTGEIVLVKATPEYQYLPYTALRGADPCIGEDPEWKGPQGYRIYLDQAVPAVAIDGEIMTIDDAHAAGYIVPNFKLSDTAEFEYSQGTAAAPVDEDNFIETPAKYAEIEMNPEADLADRFAAVGNVIKGTYTVAAADLPGVTFDVFGEVEITKSLGSVNVDATIVWDYDGGYTDPQGVELTDAKVDHENFYADAGLVYGRDDYEINIQENKLKEYLDVELSDFSGLTPKELTVTVTYTDEDGNLVEDEAVADDVVASLITDVAINGEKLTADFIGFKWDAVYKVVAKYELPEAIITVNGTLTTIDRNREPVVLGPYTHTFIINGDELVDGENGKYYKWVSDPLHADIFKAYDYETDDQKGVINVLDNVDFLYPDKQDDFNEAELIGQLRMSANDATKENTATPYVDVNRNEIVLKTKENFNTAALISDQFSTGERDADNPNLWIGKVVTRTVTTYIGEEIEIQMQFNYEVPAYNFLHLGYYTFTPKYDDFAGKYVDKNGVEQDFIITNLDMPEEITNDEYKAKYPWKYEEPVWWSQAYPSYFNDEGDGQASHVDRVSNRYALADYDVAYVKLAELCFNVVDPDDEIMTDAEVAAAQLLVKFDYTDDELKKETAELPKVDQIDPQYMIYKSLWIDNTTFYYRTNEHPFMPVKGELYICAADDASIVLPVATRFEYDNMNSKKFPDKKLDYETYAIARWTPFQDLTAEGAGIILDENKIYSVPLFKGMNLKDRRPNGVEFDVLKDGEWVLGNAEANATAASETNGYLDGVMANEAYHITTAFDFSKVNLPSNLKKLLYIKYEDPRGGWLDEIPEGADPARYTPYVFFNYTSETQWHGVVTIPVIVTLENPWQETLVCSYDFVIKGFDD